MTKNNPGLYDCYANAEPDEPLFTLLARDLTAQYFVAAWAAVRVGDLDEAKLQMDYAADALEQSRKAWKDRADPKIVEALSCSREMGSWLLRKQRDTD